MDRLTRRGISLGVMRETIRNPDKTEAGYEGRKLAVKTFGNYTYVIVYEEISATEVRAVTAYVRMR